MNETLYDWDGLIHELNQGLLLPQDFYSQQNVVDLEWQRLFHKSWQYVGSTQFLKVTGDFITGTCGKIPVMIVKNETGLQGFLNVCRHRRHEVVKGSGNLPHLQCPYHAWTYDLKGQLRSAPRCKNEGEFHPEDHSLVPVQVEVFGPFVFANADLEAAPLLPRLQPLGEMISKSGLDLNDLVSHGQEKWEAGANWKVMIENYLECYHCPTQHPSFTKVINVKPEAYLLKSYDHFLSQTAPARQLGIVAKEANTDFIGEVREAQYHLIWPNITLSINPGPPNLTLDLFLPNGPTGSMGISEHFFGSSVSPEAARKITEFNTQVGIEDDLLTRSVQRSFDFNFPKRSRALPQTEQLVIEFQKRLCRSLGNQVLP